LFTAATPTVAELFAPTALPLAELEREGFTRGAPDAEAGRIDSRGLWAMKCRCCPQRGLDYVPYVHRYRHTDRSARIGPSPSAGRAATRRSSSVRSLLPRPHRRGRPQRSAPGRVGDDPGSERAPLPVHVDVICESIIEGSVLDYSDVKVTPEPAAAPGTTDDFDADLIGEIERVSGLFLEGVQIMRGVVSGLKRRMSARLDKAKPEAATG
jgi:hypothetical protein